MKSNKIKLKATTAFIAVVAVCIATLAVLQSAHAQTSAAIQNVIPQSESVTLQAKITAIDPSTRTVTLKNAQGDKFTVIAGQGVRLDMLKVGQTVNAQYYRSVAFVINPPQGGMGVPVSNDQFMQVTAQPVTGPGGVVVQVVKMTGTVVGIDRSSNSVSIVNPSGGPVVTIDVTNPARAAMLSQLKVGDTISAVVSQELAVSITPAPKRWW